MYYSFLIHIDYYQLTRNFQNKSSFSLHNADLRETQLACNLHMRIETVGIGVGRVYFVNDDQVEIAIPPGFVVLNGSTNQPAQPFMQSFMLAWTDDFTVTFQGQQVLEFYNQRQWRLRGHPDRAVHTLDR